MIDHLSYLKYGLCYGVYLKYGLCYGVFGVTLRYLRFYLITTVNFYYIINKLIILISGLH
jgi:hypothetical protein